MDARESENNRWGKRKERGSEGKNESTSRSRVAGEKEARVNGDQGARIRKRATAKGQAMEIER